MDAIPSDYVEAMNHMFTSMARAGQAAVGVRDLLAKHFQLTMRWEARARRAESRLEAANIPGSQTEDDKDITKIIANLHVRLSEQKAAARRATHVLNKRHKKELSEVDASAYSQGTAAAEDRLNAQLEDLQEIIHRDSFFKGWEARGSVPSEGASAQTPVVPSFVMPEFTPPDKPHWRT